MEAQSQSVVNHDGEIKEAAATAASAGEAAGQALGEALAKQAANENLTAISDLPPEPGAIEQIGTGIFAIRPIDTDDTSSLLSRAIADTRYASGSITDIAAGLVQRIAGQALSGHRAVLIAVDNKAYYSNPDATARFTIGITTGAAALGATATIQLDGEIEEPSWSWSASEIVWLGASGALTQAVPTTGYAFQVGIPMGPTRLRIEPQLIAKLS
jgi:hypothetical protein